MNNHLHNTELYFIPSPTPVKVQISDAQDARRIAFGIVIQEVEGAGDVTVRDLYNAIERNVGDLREQTKSLLAVLPEGEWIWPRWQDHIEKKRDIERRKQRDDFLEAPFSELLRNKTVPQLKELHLNWLDEKPKSRMRKADLIDALSTAASPQQASALRQEMIQSLPNIERFERKEMARALAVRITVLAQRLHRRAQMLDVTEYRPYWKFVATEDADTPQECRELDGTIKRYDNEFWERHYPPCWKPDCGCTVFSLSERGLGSGA